MLVDLFTDVFMDRCIGTTCSKVVDNLAEEQDMGTTNGATADAWFVGGAFEVQVGEDAIDCGLPEVWRFRMACCTGRTCPSGTDE